MTTSIPNLPLPSEQMFGIPVDVRLPAVGQPVWLFEPGREPWLGGRGEDGDEWFWGNCNDSLYLTEKGTWACSELLIDDDYQPTHWANHAVRGTLTRNRGQR